MLTQLGGKKVVRCDGCYEVIGEAEMITKGRGYTIRGKDPRVLTEDHSIDACSQPCAVKASDSKRGQRYRCPDCVFTNQPTCNHRRR